MVVSVRAGRQLQRDPNSDVRGRRPICGHLIQPFEGDRACQRVVTRAQGLRVVGDHDRFAGFVGPHLHPHLVGPGIPAVRFESEQVVVCSRVGLSETDVAQPMEVLDSYGRDAYSVFGDLSGNRLHARFLRDRIPIEEEERPFTHIRTEFPVAPLDSQALQATSPFEVGSTAGGLNSRPVS